MLNDNFQYFKQQKKACFFYYIKVVLSNVLARQRFYCSDTKYFMRQQSLTPVRSRQLDNACGALPRQIL